MTTPFPAHAQDPFGDGIASFALQDYETAAQLWHPLARAGDTRAQYRLGMLFERGLGVAQDSQCAKIWYVRAAQAGHADAAYRLATLLSRQGEADAARHWLLQAAKRGIAHAQYELGVALARGAALEEATDWLKAALKGFAGQPEAELVGAALTALERHKGSQQAHRQRSEENS